MWRKRAEGTGKHEGESVPWYHISLDSPARSEQTAHRSAAHLRLRWLPLFLTHLFVTGNQRF